jgi:putative acetyltransferase
MPLPSDTPLSTTLRTRRFQAGDESALFRVHRSAIESIASRDYSPEQIRAWMPTFEERDAWAQRVRALAPFVALDGEEVVGYADLQADGLIDHFFVSGHHPRRGIGALLMRRLHEEAAALGLQALHAHVSLSAEAFFRRFGFEVVERRLPVRRGLALPNALMRKRLGVGEHPTGERP